MGLPSRFIIHTETFLEEAKSYKDYLELLGYRKESCHAKYGYLKEFFSYLEQNRICTLEAVTPMHIADFYDYIRQRPSRRTDKPLTGKGIYSIMRCVQMYLGYILHQGKIASNPSSHLKFTYRDEAVERMIFTAEQIRQLYESAETLQHRTILHMGYGCGLRVGELSRLNKEDIRPEENLVIVEKGKNSKRRLVPITGKIREELGEYLESCRNTGQEALFLNAKGIRMQQWTFNRELKIMIRRTAFGKGLPEEEISRIGIHSLRHSIATHLIANGMSLQQVQIFLGHSYIESTETYTHITQNQLNGLKR